MGVFSRLRRSRKIDDLNGLVGFLERHGAFMAQKSIYEYARARSGLLSAKLLDEAAFRSAAERAKWRNYVLCIEHLSVMVQGVLRRTDARGAGAGAGAEPGSGPATGLADVVAALFRRHPVPPGEAADFWDAALVAVRRRLAEAALAPVGPVKDIPDATAAAFIANMPIHPDLRIHDGRVITSNLKGHLLRAHDDFVATADHERLAELLGPAPYG